MLIKLNPFQLTPTKLFSTWPPRLPSAFASVVGQVGQGVQWCYSQLLQWSSFYPQATKPLHQAYGDSAWQARQTWQSELCKCLNTYYNELIDTHAGLQDEPSVDPLTQAFQVVPNQHLQDALISLQADLLSPIFYNRQLNKLEKRLKHQMVFSPVQRQHYQASLQAVQQQLRETLFQHPSQALDYFYEDVLHYVLLMREDIYSHQPLTVKQVLGYVNYYEGLVPERLYASVKTQLKSFASRYESAKECDTLFTASLPMSVYEQLWQTLKELLTAYELETCDHRIQLNQPEVTVEEEHPLTLAYTGTYSWGSKAAAVCLAATAATLIVTFGSGYLRKGAALAPPPWPMTELPGLWSNSYGLSSVVTQATISYGMLQQDAWGQGSKSHILPLLGGWLVGLPYTFAQTTGMVANETFINTWGGASSEDSRDLQVVPDGYVVTGSTASFGAGNTDVLLQKWALNGTLLWSKTWGGATSDYGRALQVVTDGYVVTGYTYSFGAGYADVLLQKWALNGTLLWSKTWGGGANDDIGNALQVVADGYVVTGSTASFDVAGNTDVLLQKWALNGTLLWAKVWSGANYDRGYALQVVADGYVVTGSTTSFGAGSADMLLQKWALNGTLLWSKTWGGAASDYGTALQVVADGYVVTGATASFGVGNTDVLLQKWALNGTLLWSKTWGGAASDYGTALQVVADGYVVTGATASSGVGNTDMLLQKWALDGTLLWSKTWGGATSEYGIALQVVPDGYVVIGTTTSFGAGNNDVLLQKWDVNGNVINCNGILAMNAGNVTTPTGIKGDTLDTIITPSTNAVDISNNGTLTMPRTPSQSLCNATTTQGIMTTAFVTTQGSNPSDSEENTDAISAADARQAPSRATIGMAGAITGLLVLGNLGFFAACKQKLRKAPSKATGGITVDGQELSKSLRK